MNTFCHLNRQPETNEIGRADNAAPIETCGDTSGYSR